MFYKGFLSSLVSYPFLAKGLGMDVDIWVEINIKTVTMGYSDFVV